MIIIPKETPVIQGLNTHYLNVGRLIEHCQSEFGFGVIHFLSPSGEGILFFDKDDVLNGLYKDRESDLIKGNEAVNKLFAAVDDLNFTLSVYSIEPNKIYFWANMQSAEVVYKDLSTEFTDLEGLMNKMTSEKLTGYIDVHAKDGEESGRVFFIDGNIIGGSYSWDQGEVNVTQESRNQLFEKTKSLGGIFHVSRVSTSKPTLTSKPSTAVASEEGVIVPLEELLGLLERTVQGGRFHKGNFTTALKKKFIEMADSYPFLDPFSGDFEYVDKAIQFNGVASPDELMHGVTESVKELAQELGAWPGFSQEIGPWQRKHADLLSRYGISL